MVYAHLYLLDHAISTLYTVYFGVVWYVYNPHDGRRDATSQARKELLEGHNRASTGIDDPARLWETGESDAERVRKALGVWNDEKGFATAVLVLGWLLKVRTKNPSLISCASLTQRYTLQVYFILILYSYALHLRRNTFRPLLASQQAAKAAALPASRRPSQAAHGNAYAYQHLRNTSTASAGGAGEVVWDPEDEDADGNNGYELPQSAGNSASNRRNGSRG